MAKDKDKKKGAEKQRVVTPPFRVSYPHVFKPQAMKGKNGKETGDPKYSIVMLFKKSEDISVLKLAIKHAKITEFGPDKDEWPDELESPIIDGDSPKYAVREGYKGHWAIKASSIESQKPGVVDADAEPIVNPADFYPGCYARAQVFARVWEFGANQGVHFILDHVQKIKDGKSFGGKKDVSEVFKPIDADDDDDSDDSDDDDDSDSNSFM